MISSKRIKEIKDLVSKIELTRNDKNNKTRIYMIGTEESPILIRGMKELLADREAYLVICAKDKKIFDMLLNRAKKDEGLFEKRMNEIK